MKPKTKSVVETKWFYMQDTAFDLLQEDAVPRRCFPSALIAYRALCAVGGETDSEPAPGRAGKPFQTTIARLAFMVHQPVPLALARFRDFERLGLIDPLTIPPDPNTPFTVLLRTVSFPPEGRKP